jgi:Uncharacterized protein conserved in bacteria (DUF2188)
MVGHWRSGKPAMGAQGVNERTSKMPKQPQHYHITHRQDGSWAVIGAGNQRASSLHTTQAAAIGAGKPLAQGAGGELRIHGRDNLIRESWSYGNDPCPPQG